MRIKKWLIIRRTVQFLVLVLLMSPLWIPKVFDGVTESKYYYGFFNGIMTTSKFLGIPLADPFAAAQILLAGITAATSLLLGALIVAGVYWIVGGRTFCSWACPLNMLLEAVEYLRRYLPVGDKTMNPWIKYYLLGFALVLSLVLTIPAYEVFSPVAVFSRELVYGWGAEVGIILAIVFFDLFVAERGWCRYVCPQGAAYALLGKTSPFGVELTADKCNHCMQCRKHCLVGEELMTRVVENAERYVPSGECSNCGSCIDECKRGALRFGWRLPGKKAPGTQESNLHT